MKKIVILIVVAILGWLISLPGDMPHAKLDRYEKAQLLEPSVDVGGRCKQGKCLIVYVAPWCPSCKSLTPMINRLVSDLNRDGVKATVVIGKDSMRDVLSYSKRFESSILVDANGNYFDKIDARGVPYFAVTNGAGKRITTMSGGYHSVDDMRAQLGI